VMIEAMASGTPVLAFREGAATELVVDGESGFLVDDEAEMAAAVERLDTLDPARCRAAVEARYDIAIVTEAYVATYRRVLAAAGRDRSLGSAR
jgi:glycosyltransferase involved in cell wall biosynthesis